MSAADAAAEILRREQASPGSVPPALLAKAKTLAGGGGAGSVMLPEITIRGDSRDLMGRVFGGDVDAQGREMPPGGAFLPNGQSVEQPGKAEQFLKQATGAAFVGGNEFTNAGLLGLPQATGMIPGKDTPGYGALRADHPIAALGGQVAGLMNPANPANLAGSAIAAPIRGAVGGMAGRALAGGVEGAVAGGAGSGAITAAGGGSGDQIFSAAATGAGVGGAFGATGSLAHSVLQAPGQWVRQLIGSHGPTAAPPGPPGASPPTGPVPPIPDLEVPPRPDPVASAAPHEPTLPVEETALSTVHRPLPGDTGMGAEEARRALDTDALHMANRTAAVQKIMGRLPDGADAEWLSRMSPNDRALVAKYAGVTQAGEDTWRAVSDALDARKFSGLPAPNAPQPGTMPDVSSALAQERAGRGAAYLQNPPPPPAAPPQAPPGGMGMAGLPPDAIQMGLSALRGHGMGHGPLGIDPMLGMLLQSPAFIKATGMAAGTKLPAAQQRQPGQPIDILNLYGM